MSGNGPPPFDPTELVAVSAHSSWTPAVAGALAVVALRIVRFVLDLVRSYHQTTEAEFEAALTSTDLGVLSTYLKSKLGALSIHDYVGKSIPRERVDKYLTRLTEFVATDLAKMDEGAIIPPPQTPGISADNLQPIIGPLPGDPPEIVKAIEQVQDGAVWTALATLRRDLEMKLRFRLSTGGRNREQDRKVVRFSDAMGVLGKDVAPSYAFFRHVANRGVHGEDVSMQEAEQAINAAREAYKALARPAS